MPTAISTDQSVSQGQHKVIHNKSNSDSCQSHSPETPPTRPGEEDITDEDEPERLRERTLIPRKSQVSLLVQRCGHL